MAKRKKKKEARMTDEQRARKELIETIGVLRCPDDTIEELSYVMQNAVVNSGMAYRFATFAELTWANRPANRGEIVAIAHALKEEHQRYRVAVEALLDRVDALGTPEHDEKEHLDPQDVLARLQPFFDEVMNEVDPPVELGKELPEVEEDVWYATPALKVRGKGFVRLKEDKKDVVFMLENTEEQEVLCENQPAVYYVTDHYKGYAAVLARLSKLTVKEARLRLERGWRVKAPKSLLK